jgi:hypothetical protein
LRGAGVPAASLERVRTPAGLDIGARTHARSRCRSSPSSSRSVARRWCLPWLAPSTRRGRPWTRCAA